MNEYIDIEEQAEFLADLLMTLSEIPNQSDHEAEEYPVSFASFEAIRYVAKVLPQSNITREHMDFLRKIIKSVEAEAGIFDE